MNTHQTPVARRSSIDLTPFQQIGLDSGALGRLGAVIHRFDEPGRYVGLAISNGRPAGEYSIVVSDDGPPSADVDLTRADSAGRSTSSGGGCGCGCCGDGGTKHDDAPPDVEVAPGGYVTFHVGSGNRKWSTVVHRAGGDVEFDSTRLGKGDLFAGTVMRPGTYSVRNGDGKESTKLTVGYVRPGKEAFRPGEPVHVHMTGKASRASHRVAPTQGLVFEITEPTRVVIDLLKPDDGKTRK